MNGRSKLLNPHIQLVEFNTACLIGDSFSDRSSTLATQQQFLNLVTAKWKSQYRVDKR